MNALSGPVQAAKASEKITSCLLVKIGTYCFTNFNVEIPYGGDTYIPWVMQMDAIKSSDASPLDGTTVKLANGGTNEDNQDLVSAMILGNYITNAIVTIREAIFDDHLAFIGIYIIFSGKVDGRPGLDENWGTIVIASFKNPWTQRFPRRRVTRSCGWFFKDADCQYAGSLPGPCLKTWEACQSFSNTSRFGGFRFKPVSGDRIVWGTTITVFN